MDSFDAINEMSTQGLAALQRYIAECQDGYDIKGDLLGKIQNRIDYRNELSEFKKHGTPASNPFWQNDFEQELVEDRGFLEFSDGSLLSIGAIQDIFSVQVNGMKEYIISFSSDKPTMVLSGGDYLLLKPFLKILFAISQDTQIPAGVQAMIDLADTSPERDRCFKGDDIENTGATYS